MAIGMTGIIKLGLIQWPLSDIIGMQERFCDITRNFIDRNLVDLMTRFSVPEECLCARGIHLKEQSTLRSVG